MANMKFFLFHLMPYAHLDLDYDKKHRAAWVVLPNSYYDPVKGGELYNRYLDELIYGEELGFDGLCVNEHHQNAYGLMPSPIVPASILARQTKRAKIAILGSCFGLRDQPLTVAEEHAMIDCISGGRLISGMVRGIGPEFYTFGANPAQSLERFREAHDLVVRAWSEVGPFAFEGKHYHFEYVNLWPRPIQRPHPPIWCPSLGSEETIEWATDPERKYVYLQTYSPFKAVARYLNEYRRMAASKGWTATSDKIGWAVPIYISDTDEKAKEESKPHFEMFFNKLLRNPREMLLPPGYLSTRSMKSVMQHKAGVGQLQTMDGLLANEVIVVGSPETVRKKLIECQRRTNLGNLVTMLQFGSLPADLTKRNMDFFAREIMPALRGLGDHTADPLAMAAE